MTETRTPALSSLSSLSSLSWWDRQFKFSALLPDFEARLESMRRRSASVATHSRLQYGAHERQWLEFHGDPSGGLQAAFIHGGYWRALDAPMHRFVLPGLAARGGQPANLEYRLMPGCRMAEVAGDVAGGIGQLLHHSEAQLLLIGHSAGAHLAVAAMSDFAHRERIAGIVAISGIYDLEPVTWSSLQCEIGLQDDEAARWSPIYFDFPLPPLLCVVGGDETPEFHRQAEIMVRRHRAQIVRVKDADHVNILDSLAAPASPLQRAIDRFTQGETPPSAVDGVQ